MIGKRVKAAKANNAAGHAGNLVDYISDNKKGKIMHSGGVGFITTNPAAQKLEMSALASSNPLSKNPINHYILSWREDEKPTTEQIDQAVQITLDEMGMNEHQAIYSAHHDTNNIHVHIVINRIHPDTNKSIEINKGFDLDPLHRAVVKIEHLQGWKPLENARYKVLEDGEVVEVNAERKQQRKPQQRAADFENRTGQKSAQRIGIEAVAPIVKQANDWQQLHQQLANIGIQYRKKGSGAVLIVGETAIKASSADRAASLGTLEKRIGTYEPPIEHLQITAIDPQPLTENMPSGWAEYTQLRTSYHTNKSTDADKFRERWDDQKRQLAAQQQQQREELLSGRWKGKGAILNALRSTLASDQKEAKKILQQQQDLERQNLREKYPPFPSFEEWQRLRGEPNLAEQWRYRHGESSPNLVVRVPVPQVENEQKRGYGMKM